MNDLTTYTDFFKEIVNTINSTKYEAYKALNKHHIGQNFEIGKLIVQNQEKNNWGKSIVDTLSRDINKIIDGAKGYSPQNLWRMRQFYLEYKDNTDLLELALTIPWGQNLLILHQVKDIEERAYYLNATNKLGWSRAVLLNQIKANAYRHHLKDPKQSNFEKALPVHLSEQANEAMKSEYNLDFLGITKPVLEKELENRLVENIRDLLLELGYGFSFIGNQYRLKLNQKEYFIDLLFYHRILKCLVAIELKTVEFEPEFAGKMNFYLELLDEQEKQLDDNPSIGIILCPIKDNLEVEYTLRTNNKPIGVSSYKLTQELPNNLKGKVPTSEELKRMLTMAINNSVDSDKSKDND
ncbi:PDDEXK nuclease domain-containing protein [Aquimarina aggregata]|uniref:PDDEXK nuclease domain-containing protein n=1 Tax=Aquimarina aggregata TaxID=1642818 RepID=UPI0024933A5F|nr:PDDEXK nuclease domain-containing protein [Aquimarina aggregata]